MANLLTITKETDGYFTFVLNGDSTNAIKNTRNDLLTVGNLAHFKTANGANLIKEQDILFSNITIIDGATSVVPTSVDDLFNDLDNVGFFDWINGAGGSGGVNRFDELEDTFSYFGKDGQAVRVNESELKLEPFAMPDVSYLSKFPTPLVAGKILKVNAGATAYELVNAINVITQEIRLGYTETSSSEDVIHKALALKANITDLPTGLTEQLDFEANGTDNFIDIGTNAVVKSVFHNSTIQLRDSWSQAGSVITFTLTPDPGLGYKNLTFI